MKNRLPAAAAALVLAAVGAGIGVAIYASARPGGTTTVVNTVTTGGSAGQQIAASTGLTATEIFRRTYQGVVDIRVVGPTSSFSFGRSGSQSESAEGSGFVFDATGDILTNQHVIDSATSITVRFWNGASYKAHLVGADSSADLAIIKISAPASILHPLTLGDSSKVQVGDGVVAIGSPFGLAETMTSGIVSALHRSIGSQSRFTTSDAIQTDAPINHGNSGGPLINAAGQVIGVNTQIQSNSGGSDGVGFAVPSNTIRRVATKLVAGETVKYAYLGIGVEDASTAANATAGARATEVAAGTPAARAGLKAGDVIVKLDDTTVSSSEDLTRKMDSKQPGDKLVVTYLRGGTSHTVTVTLGTRPA